jgi:hypothetical protein
MKGIYIMVITLCVFITNKSQAQEPPCTTNQYINQLNESALRKSLEAVVIGSTAQTTLTINVAFHIYNNCLTPSHTSEMIQILNESFQNHNIQFNKYCDYFYSTGTTTVKLPYVINIHIDDSFSNEADGVGSNSFYLRKYDWNSSSLPHEMGHCLNLYHTHNERNCLELVDGSNCEVCGDYVCDTPADPGLYQQRYLVDDNCIFDNSIKQNGVPYHPDTKNFMSYSRPECRAHFTIEQGKRMYYSLISLDVLKPVIKAPEIQGPSQVCDKASFDFKVLPNSTVTWSSSNSLGLKINSVSGEATRVNNFSGELTITASITNPCGYPSSLKKKVTVGTGIADPLLDYIMVTCNSTPYIYDLMAKVKPSSGTATYKWYIDNVLKKTTSFNETPIPGGIVDNKLHYLKVEIITDCGIVNTASQEGTFRATCGWTKGVGGGTFAISPNPVSNDLTIEFVSDDESDELQVDAIDITIYDKFQNKVFSSAMLDRLVRISTANLQNDIYYVHIKSNQGTINRRILVNR